MEAARLGDLGLLTIGGWLADDAVVGVFLTQALHRQLHRALGAFVSHRNVSLLLWRRISIGCNICYIMSAAAGASPRWLLFVHQLPATPSNIRVKTWRRLQQIGAVPMKNSIYVLPNTAQTVEDFEWLRTEVVSLGGAASIFEAATISGIDETEIVSAFQTARARDFVALSKELRAFRAKLRRGRPDTGQRKTILSLQERLDTLKRIDFFPSAASSHAESAMQKLQPEASGGRQSAYPPSGVIDKRE